MRQTLAVVVTYNRITLLQECVLELQSQTQPVDILLVDNASTDGTTDWVRKAAEDAHVFGLFMENNSGGAGGFHAGMQWGVEAGYEYVWIMDDDTIPESDALEKLMQEGETLPGDGVFGFLSSTVLWTDGTPCLMNGQHVLREEDGRTRVDSATFVSLLFSSEAIEKVGLPLKEYFIWGDDKEYTLRTADAFPCYWVKDSVVIHKMKSNAGSNIVTDDAERIERYFYAYRNDLCTARRRSAGAVLIYLAAFCLNLLRVLLRGKEHKGKRMAVMWRGLLAGLGFHPSVTFVRRTNLYEGQS